MAIRNIIHINEKKCDGCGQCVIDCAEGALQIVGGKAKLVKEIYCDGLGACIGACPTGALTVIQREADPFDEEATERYLRDTGKQRERMQECPGSASREFSPESEKPQRAGETMAELSNWPVQLKLIAPDAPFLNGADLLFAADCTAFAASNFQSRFVKGKKVLIACPKLDNAQYYLEKLEEVFHRNSVKSITVVRMEVPCCGGLSFIVKQAMRDSGKSIPYREVVIGVKGVLLSETSQH
jgi:ferredoxin